MIFGCFAHGKDVPRRVRWIACKLLHVHIPISGGCIMMSRNPNAASILSDLFWTCFWEPGTFAKDLVEAPETLPQVFMD